MIKDTSINSTYPTRTFDFFSVKPVEDDLHRGWKILHDWPDIFWTDANGGHWVFTRAADISAAWLDAKRFSNRGVSMSHEQRELRLIPGEIDPPEHSAFRRPLQSFFSPKAVAALEIDIRAYAHAMIGAVRDQGFCEFQEKVAKQLPVHVFLSMMELPTAHAEQLLPVADLLTRDPDPTAHAHATNIMMMYLQDRVAERRHRGGLDFISQMLVAEIDGRIQSEIEVLGITANIMFGGLDTVVSTMGFIMNFLARSPQHRSLLLADPKRITKAIEEMIRRFSISNFGRTLTEDIVYNDISMKAGDLVLLPAALHNLDERKYPNPMAVDFDRKDTSHMGFGTGIHRCLGAQLARTELRIFLEEWLTCIPEFEIDSGAKVEMMSGRINAITSLPLKW